MKKNNLLLIIGLISMVFVSSCEKDEPEDPIIPHEEEVITTLNYTLTPDSGDAVVLTFQDLDGDGGDDPIITGGTLIANTTYSGSLELLNEIESPADDITEEIEEEGVDHQFFFQTTVNDMDVAYNDMDANGHPIGLASILTTNGMNSGTLTIILRHEPSKDAAGVSDGDITNAGGETDIEVTFDVDIQ